MKLSFFNDNPQLSDDLEVVKEIIKQEITSNESRFSDVIEASFNENSKMVRPALVLIGASYNSRIKKKALNLAAATEMMHVASLIHDDIIDQAKIRRMQPTINEQYDDGYAVICGDFLFSKSFELIFKTQDIKGISMMGNNVTKMVFGEVEQYLNRFNINMSIDDYLSIIDKKTANFMATSLALGAHLAKVDANEIEKLKTVGQNFGIYFQLQDDLLDFSQEKIIGKSSQSDIKRGNYSLPLIITLQEDASLKEYLEKSDEFDYKFVYKKLEEHDAFTISQTYLDNYYQKIIDSIESLTKQSVKDQLYYLLNKLNKRQK